jgi:hypothetical protein
MARLALKDQCVTLEHAATILDRQTRPHAATKRSPRKSLNYWRSVAVSSAIINKVYTMNIIQNVNCRSRHCIEEVMFPMLSHLFMMNQSFEKVGVIQVVVAMEGAADKSTVERDLERSMVEGQKREVSGDSSVNSREGALIVG